MIVAGQDGEGSGAKVIDRLSYDLKKFFGRVWFFAVEPAVAYVNHNIPTLATCDMFDCLAMPDPYWDESLRAKEFCIEKWYNMGMHRRVEP